MNLQLFIVIIIGIAVAFKVIHGVYRFFFQRNGSSYCGSCKACEFNPENITNKNRSF